MRSMANVSTMGKSGVAAALSPCTSQRASSRPAAPPAKASTRLSVIICRNSRVRLAPSAERTAISRARSVPRVSNKFARFTHAMRSTTPTPPNSTNMARRISGSTMYSRSGMRSLLYPLREAECSCATRSAIAATRARACTNGTEGRKRAMDRKIMLSRRVRTSSFSNDGRNGSHTSSAVGHSRSEGTTPAIVRTLPPRRID